MKKLYKLKGWFLLPDAAKRLSAGLEEEVSVKDVLQLAIEGALPISCYVRDLPARRYPPQTEIKDTELSKENLTNENNEIGRNTPTSESIDQVTITENNFGYKPDELLRGTYKVDLEKCSAIKDWLYGVLSESEQEIRFRDGFFLTDENGDTWQVLDYANHLVVAMPNGEIVEQGPQYVPRLSFPSDSDLVVQRQHIELFEETLQMPSSGKTIHPRTETSYLKIIAALLDVIRNGIPNAENLGTEIGPASEFQSEAQLITSIVKHYQGYSGLSKSTLEKKFSEAKRSLATASEIH